MTDNSNGFPGSFGWDSAGRRNTLNRLFFYAGVFLLMCNPVAPQSGQFPFHNSDLPVEERVEDLVSRLTLEEKVSQMVYQAPAIERLGVPDYNWWNECLHGVGRAGLATVFPQAIGLAATWDSPHLLQVATVISDEARAKHHEFVRRGKRSIYQGLTFWTPNINIFRDPRWGRGQETYGEDPYLTARMAVSFIKGLQGDDPKYLKLVATAKHFAVHSGPEPDRHTFDAIVDDRDLVETYLPAFEATVREAKVRSIMCAYNRFRGDAACGSRFLLEDILRKEWGFDGYVVSDCWAIVDIFRSHKIVATPEEAAALSVRAGTDLNCGSTFPSLVKALERGLIEETELDRAVGRLLEARFRLGMFDEPERVPWARIPYSVVSSPGHRQLALESARESIVLLKNSANTLPLDKQMKSIAVIGPNADNPSILLGNYNGTPESLVTPLQGIRSKVSSDTTVYWAEGCEIAPGVPAVEVIPSSYLRPVSPGPTRNGLTGSYFSSAKPDQEPSFTRTDSTVDFVWLNETPLGKGMADEFSAAWEGFLVPPVSGTYRLGGSGLTGFRLALDGEDLVSYRGEHHAVVRTEETFLEAGRQYRIRLEYWNESSDPQVQLLWSLPRRDLESEALDIATKAEVVVFVGGLSPRLEGEEMPVQVEGFLGGDRTDIRLPESQTKLLQRLSRLGKPIVLVLLNGSAVSLEWADQNVPSILTAWYPGQAGGSAIADVLFGDYNPAGRLPVTFYRSTEDLPPFGEYKMDNRTYRYFRGKPLYPFGHGLSYTSFNYENLTITPDALDADKGVGVSVEVVNTGKLAGDEVVQLYVSDLEANVPVPIRSLQGFARVHLTPGERKTVSFHLAARQFAIIDEPFRRILEPGEFEITVGGKQPGQQGNADASTTKTLSRRIAFRADRPVVVK